MKTVAVQGANGLEDMYLKHTINSTKTNPKRGG
jgi:hypothetical protein